MSEHAIEGQPNSQSAAVSPSLLGTVLAIQANYYWVKLNEAPDLSDDRALPQTLLCTRRARLKKMGQQVMVGDRVEIEEPDWADGRGAISRVLERQTVLDRPPIANANQILLVFALAQPPLEPLQLSRFLVKAESTRLAVRLALNKSDLLTEAERQQWRDRLRNWGYTPAMISVQQQWGLEGLQHLLQRQITVVSGPSGVGKSSLINSLIPSVELRVGEVSGKLRHGRHTTRHVELFELAMGGLLADSPGFNQPDLDCEPAELAQFFPEVRQRLAQADCQFSDCLHRNEPNCAVRGDWERYEHYLRFLEEVIARQEAIDRRSEEATSKVKVGEDGRPQIEPKLATKKYRRPSRRSEKQSLLDLYHDAEGAMQEPD